MSLSLLQNYRINLYKIQYRWFTLKITGQMSLSYNSYFVWS